MAGATGRVETVKYLLSKGADVNLRKEPDGTSALHRAATLKDREVRARQGGGSNQVNPYLTRESWRWSRVYSGYI